MINRTLVFGVFILLSILSCSNFHNASKTLQYSTSNDSTLYYYKKGWKQIMDLGAYTDAEVSYRKALRFDPNFLLGKSVLARLTSDLEERLNLYRELEAEKETLNDAERKIFEVYKALTYFTNVREQTPKKAKATLDSVFVIAEKNLREIVHRYPNEIYLKAEYIEVLHSLYGAEITIDSLNVLTEEDPVVNPFLLGYEAELEAEVGNFETAIQKARELERLMQSYKTPKPYAVLAAIYFDMDSLQKAKSYADKAFQLDPRNLDASRIKTKIDQKLQGAPL